MEAKPAEVLTTLVEVVMARSEAEAEAAVVAEHSSSGMLLPLRPPGLDHVWDWRCWKAFLGCLGVVCVWRQFGAVARRLACI